MASSEMSFSHCAWARQLLSLRSLEPKQSSLVTRTLPGTWPEPKLEPSLRTWAPLALISFPP